MGSASECTQETGIVNLARFCSHTDSFFFSVQNQELLLKFTLFTANQKDKTGKKLDQNKNLDIICVKCYNNLLHFQKS